MANSFSEPLFIPHGDELNDLDTDKILKEAEDFVLLAQSKLVSMADWNSMKTSRNVRRELCKNFYFNLSVRMSFASYNQLTGFPLFLTQFRS